jgi:very-short-patch-repair endonuclease
MTGTALRCLFLRDVDEQLAIALAHGGGLIRVGRNSPIRGRVDGAVRRGELERVLSGIYAATGTVDCGRRCHALHLADGDVVIMGEAAAWLLGLPDAKEPQRVTALSTTLRLDTPRFRTLDRHLDPELVGIARGLRVTCPALTALDLAATQGGRPIDAALRSGIPLTTLWSVFRGLPHRPGNATLRRLLIESRDEPWSEAERSAHLLLHRARLSGWRTNHPVSVSLGLVHVDVGFPRLRLALEIDGYEFHSSRSQFERDRARDVALGLVDWVVHRFTADHVFGRPESFLEEVRGLLSARERLLGRAA